MIKKVLIANRGEIAVRIIRACRDLGIASVAVYSKEDQDSLHVALADQKVCIGEGPISQSYLNKANIISAALNTKAEAIHPGFGFLSENADFARLCQEYGLIFIGPRPEVIEQMGDKAQARATMIKAQVPVVPGSPGHLTDLAKAKTWAETIGFPIMIKAASGGGGKGMRVSRSAHDFEAQFTIAQSEAVSSFGDPAMYLEKYIEQPKHIEIQLMADQFGQVVALGERDCSIQRNHQKLIEEAPSPAIDQATRQALNETAIKAAQAVNYSNAGTVEFIMDKDKQFYFMEMNTRIQVEHGVTEMVTGLDLIIEQIRVASGLPLSIKQEDVVIRGHAIECRISAEIPSKNFMPNAGPINHLHLPAGNGVRVDTALYTGYRVPADYDAMIAKVIVHAPDRPAAIQKMKTALSEMVILGLETNLDFQFDLMHQDDFIAGHVDTGFIAQLLNH